MPDTLTRRADELAVDILQACADRQAVLGLIHRYGDARVAAHIDAITEAVEGLPHGQVWEYRKAPRDVVGRDAVLAILRGENI